MEAEYSQLVVSNHYLEYWLLNLLCTRCLHWLGEFQIFGHVGQISALWLLTKVCSWRFLTIIWNITHWIHFIQARWVCRSDSIFGLISHISAFWLPKMFEIGCLGQPCLTCFYNTIHPHKVGFSRQVYAYIPMEFFFILLFGYANRHSGYLNMSTYTGKPALQMYCQNVCTFAFCTIFVYFAISNRSMRRRRMLIYI